MKTINTLTQEFNNMDKLPMFEIELNNGNYELYNLYIEDNNLCSMGNNGLLHLELDDVFSLDENLQEFYDVCYEDSLLTDED